MLGCETCGAGTTLCCDTCGDTCGGGITSDGRCKRADPGLARAPGLGPGCAATAAADGCMSSAAPLTGTAVICLGRPASAEAPVTRVLAEPAWLRAPRGGLTAPLEELTCARPPLRDGLMAPLEGLTTGEMSRCWLPTGMTSGDISRGWPPPEIPCGPRALGTNWPLTATNAGCAAGAVALILRERTVSMGADGVCGAVAVRLGVSCCTTIWGAWACAGS
mmetsp:Transcript_6062/g.18145  ORF Transcript_6062/g.18145 Transcript_6062/m.18145 type:complete len:220 (-) Transcript_6062:735-1394(-)